MNWVRSVNIVSAPYPVPGIKNFLIIKTFSPLQQRNGRRLLIFIEFFNFCLELIECWREFSFLQLRRCVYRLFTVTVAHGLKDDIEEMENIVPSIIDGSTTRSTFFYSIIRLRIEKMMIKSLVARLQFNCHFPVRKSPRRTRHELDFQSLSLAASRQNKSAWEKLASNHKSYFEWSHFIILIHFSRDLETVAKSLTRSFSLWHSMGWR